MHQGFYEDASVYDILHAPGTRDELDGLEHIEQRFVLDLGGKRADWLEPACGSGRLLRLAAQRGRRVVGFDLEAGMVEYTRERLERAGLTRRAHLFVADMTDFRAHVTRPVSLAFNLINTFRHLASDRDAIAHLREVRRVLAPRGVYVVGIGTTRRDWADPVEDVWHGKRGRTAVTQVVQYLPPPPRSRKETVISHITVQTPAAERHIDSTYHLRTYTSAQWWSLVRAAGMRVHAVVDEYGDDAHAPDDGYALYVLGR